MSFSDQDLERLKNDYESFCTEARNGSPHCDEHSRARGKMNILQLHTPDEFNQCQHLLAQASKSYRRYFTPNLSDTGGMWWQIGERSNVLGFFMLRGFAYPIPRFGVFIAERYSRNGLGRLALRFAESWCRLNGHADLELTVHPKHKIARRLYRQEGYCDTKQTSSRGHLVYVKNLIGGVK